MTCSVSARNPSMEVRVRRDASDRSHAERAHPTRVRILSCRGLIRQTPCDVGVNRGQVVAAQVIAVGVAGQAAMLASARDDRACGPATPRPSQTTPPPRRGNHRGGVISRASPAHRDRKAPPQHRRPPGEQHMPGVVVTPPTLAHDITTIVAFTVGRGRPDREKTRQQSGGHRHGQQDPVGGSAAQQPRRPRAPCTAPNDGAVTVTSTAGRDPTVSGIPWRPPHTPAVISCQVSAAYRSEHDGHTLARRFLHRANTVCSRPAPSAPTRCTGRAQTRTR